MLIQALSYHKTDYIASMKEIKMPRYKGSVTQRLVGGNSVISVHRLYMEMFDGDIWTALLLAQLLYWQDGRTRHPEGWVVKTYQEWHDELFISERRLDNARKKLAPLGLETKTAKSQFHDGETALHWRIDLDVFEAAQENFVKNSVAKVQDDPTRKDTASFPDSTERPILYIQNLPTKIKNTAAENSATAKTFQPSTPRATNDVMRQIQSSLGTKDEPSDGLTFLIGTFKSFFKREPSEAQVSRLSEKVSTVFDRYSGEYPSPADFAGHEQYGELFREWVLEKKNPTNGSLPPRIATKKWIEHHIRNYASPEGWLTWLKKKGIDLSPKQANPVTVTDAIYGLEYMDYFCYDRLHMRDDFAISHEFKTFYENNIGRVKSNDEFKQLFNEWRKSNG